jgi:hypothetical protein
VKDILVAIIVCPAGLTVAITMGLPKTTAKSCTVNLLRYCLGHTRAKDRKRLAAALALY